MSKYFRIFEECFFVYGRFNQAAIYNVLDGNVYTIAGKQALIVSLCEKNMPIENIARETSISTNEIMDILSKMKENNIGTFFSKPTYIEKLVIDRKWQENSFLKEPPKIMMAYLVLNSTCNQDCKYCNKNYVRKYSCIGCFRSKLPESRTSIQQYKSALDSLSKLNTEQIYFTGGDLLENYDENIELIEYATSLKFKHIFVFIGGNRKICENKLEKITELGVHIFLCVEVEKSNTLDDYLLLRNNCLHNSYSIMLTFPENITYDECNKIAQDFKNKYKPQQLFIDVAIKKENIFKSSNRRKMHNFSKTSINDFSFSLEYSKCMYGMLTIYNNGKLGVCPRMSDIPLGNISEMVECLKKDSIGYFWKRTKDTIKTCSECHLRYICDDCRYLEYELSNDVLSMNTCPLENANVYFEVE